MAYEPNKMSFIGPSAITGGDGKLWHYTGEDAVGDVDAAGYVTNAAGIGMQPRDFVLVRGADGGAAALMYCSAVSATTGAGTLVDITS